MNTLLTFLLVTGAGLFVFIKLKMDNSKLREQKKEIKELNDSNLRIIERVSIHEYNFKELKIEYEKINDVNTDNSADDLVRLFGDLNKNK